MGMNTLLSHATDSDANNYSREDRSSRLGRSNEMQNS